MKYNYRGTELLHISVIFCLLVITNGIVFLSFPYEIINSDTPLLATLFILLDVVVIILANLFFIFFNKIRGDKK